MNRLFLDTADVVALATDCISFVVMDDMGIADALTTDIHFEQAGFSILLD